MNSSELSNLILSFGSFSPKKLQKLVYYLYSWYYVLTKEIISDMSFEAWVHGPVSPELYQNYKSYGWNRIPQKSTYISSNSLFYKVAELVIEIYGDLSADELERLTHQEKPWKNARFGYSNYEPATEIIDLNDIYEFYSNHELYDNFVNLT